MRTRSLTTRAVRGYKLVLIILFTSFMISFITYYLVNGKWVGLLMFAPHGWIVYRIWNGLKLLKEVSYDEHSLYVKEKEFEVQIPFYRIKEVALTSLDGIYKFTLRDADQFGEVVYCKPSLWYPFNYKKIDRELDELRRRIEEITKQYWQSRQQDGAQGLPAMNI